MDELSRKTLAELASILGIPVEDILSHCRRAELVDARSMIVAYLSERMHARQQDIALLLDISQAAVSKLYSRHRALVGNYSDYRQYFETLLRSFTETEIENNTINHKLKNE